MNLQEKISKDVLIGILVTVSVILAAALLPFLTLPIRVLTPLPVLFYRSKLGRQDGLITLGMAALITAIIFGGISPTLLTIWSLMLMGFILGELFDKNFSIETTIITSSGILLTFIAGYVVLYSSRVQLSIPSIVFEYVNSNINILLHLFNEASVSSEVTKMIEQQREYIVNFAVLTLPASTIMTVTFIAWLNVIAAKPLYIKNNINYPNFGQLCQWRAPENLIWCLISFGLLLLVGNSNLSTIGTNGLLILLVAYFFQGIAIISFYLAKKKVPTLLKIAIYFLIAINQIFLIVIAGIGIFDIWFNFRKLETTNRDSSKQDRSNGGQK